jgi:DNA-binding LacI/PurR family transcriptional regulator
MKQTTTKPIRLKDIATRAEISVAAVSMALADHPDISS